MIVQSSYEHFFKMFSKKHTPLFFMYVYASSGTDIFKEFLLRAHCEWKQSKQYWKILGVFLYCFCLANRTHVYSWATSASRLLLGFMIIHGQWTGKQRHLETRWRCKLIFRLLSVYTCTRFNLIRLLFPFTLELFCESVDCCCICTGITFLTLLILRFTFLVVNSNKGH